MVTVIECICADGISILPYVIFKGKSVDTKWIPQDIGESWRIAATTNGWTSHLHGMEWLRRSFEPVTREKAAGRPRILICDGHGSHVTGDFIEHCMSNNIKLLILSPHSSHFTQPLDIGIFSPLKEYMTQEITPLINAKVATLQKVEWFGAYIRARGRVFSANNINGSWSGAGLVPFYPPKVLRRIRPATPTPSFTPPPSINPFDNCLLTTSPIDIAAMQTANIALNDILTHKEPLNTPVRNYIVGLTTRTERLQTQNIIL